jgi:hypothetical protein
MKGLWAIDLSKNWRITFEFRDGDVYIVITFAFLIYPRNTRKTQNGFVSKALDTHLPDNTSAKWAIKDALSFSGSMVTRSFFPCYHV